MTKKIAFISAMEEEIVPIAHFLGFTENLSVGSVVVFGDYIFALSGIGKVAAAMTLTKILEQHRVDIIINIGLAGSLSPHLCFGDVVVATKTIEHDGYFENMPETQNRLYPLFDLITVEHPELKQGVLVTGDQFITTESMRESLQVRGGQLVDMEGAALAKVAHHYAVSLLVLKIISDNANSSAEEDFEKNLHAGKRVIEHLPFILDFIKNN